MFRLFILVAGVVAVANAFGTGAPATVCGNLTPKHPAEPQTGPSPYSISINKGAIKRGDEVKVTLEGITAQDKFKGFLVKAELGDKTVGRFEVDPTDPEVQTINCPNGQKNAATHRNPDEKSKISINWIAPEDLEGVVVFKATFVKDGLTFWVAQTSSALTVHH
ncbi:putative defense protein 1 [Athalia rosae]|uniref:putative defense protein 1 n=1 Tax=Athalia rosae TaxID=37344 RepID=UPI002033B2CF|nr:putative defense protein 1 [Athalia rosae]XP_012262986.2 putative defense protein 1 [Athalia rosae]